jgi:hypothetical protein
MDIAYRVLGASLRYYSVGTGKLCTVHCGALVDPKDVPEDLFAWWQEKGGLVERVTVMPDENPQVPAANNVPTTRSPWTVDPAILRDKSLEELLVMVEERDPDAKVETIEEARFLLSRDFVQG